MSDALPRGPVTFKLGGVEYAVDRDDVDDILKHVLPRPLDEYAVLANGRLYPPKQVVSLALGVPLTKFTTMDAARIVTALGYEILETKQIARDQLRNESEQLFEMYLKAFGLAFEFEKQLDGTTKRPDFAVPHHGAEILFEVKEFRPDTDDFRPGFGYFDPYGPIREKIGAARKKFKDLDPYCCCLVLFNWGKPLVLLDWQHIYGAMLGNVGFSVPVNVRGGESSASDMRSIFMAGTGAEMIRERDGVPVDVKNTTISAIIVLQNFTVGRRRFMGAVRERERELGRSLDLHEFLAEQDRARGTERDLSLTQLRVLVHENPYARRPLPRDLFRGPYDERWGAEDNQITQVYAGEELLRLPPKD